MKILVKGKKGSLRQIVYVVILLAAVIALFQWYSVQNRKRISEQNKNYAADSARQMAVRINDELKNALNLIDTYTYFLGESLTEPEVSAQLLEEIERNTWFDACLFTDMDGMNHSSDGRSADASTRDYYLNGIKGEKGVTVVFDSKYGIPLEQSNNCRQKYYNVNNLPQRSFLSFHQNLHQPLPPPPFYPIILRAPLQVNIP